MSSFTTFGHLYNVDNDGSHPVSPSSRRLAQALTFHTQPQANTLTRSRPFVIGLVQARMGSTRLPGKVLLPLPANDDAMPVLWHVFQRLKASKAVAKWVLATSTWHTDNVLQEFGDKYGIDVWRGSEGDCLERLFTGAVAYGAKKGDYVVRITSDCPLVEARFIDQSVEECIAGKYDQYGLWDQVPRATRFADGLDVQVFSFDGMSRMNDNAKQPHEREHVGPYMMDHPDKFRLGHLKFSVVEATDRNWTLDNPRDYDFLCEVYSRLWKKEDPPFHIEALIDLLHAEPSLSEINHTPSEEQNEGLLKSFQNKLRAQGFSYDKRFIVNFKKSEHILFQKEKAFHNVQPVLQSGHGGRVKDVDGNTFIDVCLGCGGVTFGHGYDFSESEHGPLTLASTALSSRFATSNEWLCTSTLEVVTGMKCVGYARSSDCAVNIVAAIFSKAVVFDVFSDDAKTIEEARALSHASQENGQAFVINEAVSAGRFAYPSITHQHRILASGIILGPGLANGYPFYPVCVDPEYWGNASMLMDSLTPFLILPSVTSELMFATAIRAMEYFGKHFVVFNIQRYYKAFRSGLTSGIVANKLQDKVFLEEKSGQILVKLTKLSFEKEEEEFRAIISAGLIGRGVYVEKDKLAFSPCFATTIELVVQVTLAFKATLGDYVESLGL